MHLTIFLVNSFGFDGGTFGGSRFWVRENIVQPDRPQMTVQYGAYELNARYLRLQIYTQNM